MDTHTPMSLNAGITTAPLTTLILDKIVEQIDLLEEMIARVPPDQVHSTPPLPSASFPTPRSLGEVLGHLLQCLAGFLAVSHAARPGELGFLLEMKNRRINHACDREEALQRIEEYRRHLHGAFAVLTDDDLSRVVGTVFVAEGQAVLTLLLGNLEHLINHKHELFYYLKLLGVPLTSRDLYRFRNKLSRSNVERVDARG